MQDFKNRVERMAKHYGKWAKRRDIHAYRIYDKDIPQYPFSIDVYEDHLLINEFYNKNIASQPNYETWRNEALQLIADTLGYDPNHTHVKTRQKQSGKSQYNKLSQKNEFIEVREGGLKFLINLNDYLDTGLFLDHRQTRHIIRERLRKFDLEMISENNQTHSGDNAKNKEIVLKNLSDTTTDKTIVVSKQKEIRRKRFLNLFSYTGAFSVYAASGGADEIINVDTSQVYLDWFKKNLEINADTIDIKNLSYQNIRQDSRAFLSEYEGAPFNVIFCDPPVFSSGKQHERDFDVLRDHPDLIDSCLEHLSDNGVLYFSTNFRKFKLQWKPQHGNSPLLVKVKDVTAATIPEDFRNKRIHVCYEITKPAFQ